MGRWCEMMILIRPYAEQLRHAKTKTYWLQRRAGRYDLPHNVSPEKWLAIITTFGERCAYCGRSAQTVGAPMTADHFLPLCSDYTLGSLAWNIVPACQECNLNKRGDDPFIWLQKRFGREQGRAIQARILNYLAEARFWHFENRRQRRKRRK